MHFGRAQPDARADASTKDESPDAQESYQDVLGDGVRRPEASADSREDQHTEGHD